MFCVQEIDEVGDTVVFAYIELFVAEFDVAAVPCKNTCILETLVVCLQLGKSALASIAVP